MEFEKKLKNHGKIMVVSSFNYFKVHAWSTSMLLLLHSAFMLSVVKMLLKGEVGDRALNSHGNYIVDHGKSWENHGIVLLNFCGPCNVHYQNILQVNIVKIKKPEILTDTLHRYMDDPRYKDIAIDLVSILQ